MYTPDEHRRRIAPPPIATLETDALEDDMTEEGHVLDYVAMNTRSHDAARSAASTCMVDALILSLLSFFLIWLFWRMERWGGGGREREIENTKYSDWEGVW